MYDFNKHLDSDEKILYQGKSNVGKGSKNIGAGLLVIGFMLIIQFLLVWSLKTGIGDGANGFNLNYLIIFLVSLIFDAYAICLVVYTLILKNKKIADDYYCLTNKRALKYEEKTDKLVYGYLINYDDVKVINQKKNL